MLSGLSGYVKGVKKAIGNMGTAHQTTPTLGKIRIGSRNIEEIKLISQGGYAYVFQVRDAQTGEIFALKKMICQSPERLQTAKNEINYLRSLPDHPNLLKLFDTHVDNRDGCYYVYVLLEFCADGSIFDLMAKYESSRLSEKQIVFIMREVCDGVKALHSMKPAIAHRDLKIENVLLNNKRFKLCDFGSCSTSVVDFATVPQSQYHNYEEEYDKNTTLMYRPPEMCDPYQKLVVSEKVDVWMIGCILYTMCFYKHPFQEMSKLSIVNAAYTFPNEKDHSYDPKLIDIIRICLTPNPKTRPSIFDLCKIFENYFELNGVKLNADAQRIKEEHRKQAQEMAKFENNSSNLRKFNGDIPVHELMKLQQQLAHDEDSSPVHIQNKAKMSQKQASHGKLNSHKNSSDFDGFGDFNKKSQVPDPHQFHSSPGLGNSNKDWLNFDDKPQNTNHQSNHQSSFAPNKTNTQVNAQWQNFDFGGGNNGGGNSGGNSNSNANKNSSSSNQQQPNNQWNPWSQNQSQQQQVKPTQMQQQQQQPQPNLMDQGYTPSNNNQGFNNNKNNNNNWNNNNMNNPQMQMQMQKQMQMQQMNQGWNNQNSMNNMNNNRMPMNNNFNSMNGWNHQNMQMQNNNMNRMQQMNNNGWNNNNSNQNMGGFQQNNNNMQQSGNQNTTGVTNNLLDLADTKPVRLDTASGIMSLYGKK